MSNPRVIDTHTHIQFAAFEKDADLVIARALGAGIWLVNVGTQKDTSREAVRISDNYPVGVFATVGLHPIHTERSYHDEKELGVKNKELSGFEGREEKFDYEYYKKLATHEKVVAIGECGLDYAVFVREQREREQKRASAEAFGEGGLTIEERKERQQAVFIRQIELAHDVKKPLMIHCRQAFADLIDVLQATSYKLQANPGIIHFFSGTKDDAKKLLELGFSFSFGGVVTFTSDYDEVVRYIALDRIVLETDAPYVTPEPYRGKRNEPVNVKEVAKKITELKNMDYEEVASITTENAKKIFGIKSSSSAA